MALKLPFNVTRTQLNRVLSLALLVNSGFAAFSVVAFFLSAWWVFLLAGVLGFPFIIGGYYLYTKTKYREPMKRFVFNYIVKIYQGFVQHRAFLIKKIYTIFCWVVPSDEWKQISWGYAAKKSHNQQLPNLSDLEAEKKYYAQLYHYLATGMGNWNTLEGKYVLEVRSGGGGGVEFISKHLNPIRCVGVDVSSTQINYNVENKEQEEARFYKADSLEDFGKAVGLEGKTFDLVLSLQSSQYIRDFEKFMQEVDSVVRPGGIFAFTDLRTVADWPELEKQLESSSLKILRKENISQNVINAFKADRLDKFSLLNRRFGSILNSASDRVGVIKNNAVSETLKQGTAEARVYLLHKVPQRIVETSY